MIINYRTQLFFLIIFILFPMIVNAQTKFIKQVFVKHCDSLPYNLLVPNTFKNNTNDSLSVKYNNDKYPLVLFLHGAGERGNDNEVQIIHIKSLFENVSNQNKYPCFVVAPQCPKEYKWVDVDWAAKKSLIPKHASWPLFSTMDLLDYLIEKYPIDTSRIYVTGLSMGGYGTWDIISRCPNKFAAAVPICGGGDENMAKEIKHIPIWAFHGAIDNLVPVERTRNMIEAIKKAGGNPKYSEYKGVRHGSWVKAYKEKQLLEWMFAHKKTTNR